MPLRTLTAGESHGPALLAILEGMPAGLRIDKEQLDQQMARRQQGYGAGPRMKMESDTAEIMSGVLEGLTIGAPIGMRIVNKNHSQWQDKETAPMTAPRPGHADLAGVVKYGYNDLRPSLERASARETAARVAVGAICQQFLSEFGIQVGGYVRSIGTVEADLSAETNLALRAEKAEESEVRCPDAASAQKMVDEIRATMLAKDTLGGVLEIFATGLPVGLGSHVQWDRRLEAKLAAAVMSVQAMKGMEIGSAFENARARGTQVQDQIYLEGERLVRKTNRAGGLEGGMTNGEPQKTVDLVTGEETVTTYERSDFCPVPRAVPVLEAVVAFTLADALIEKLGGDSLAEMKPRFEALKQARLSDIKLSGEGHVFWE
jgi:chorismate synthase